MPRNILNDYYDFLDEFNRKSMEPTPPIPHDEQSLIVFIDWLLQDPRYREFSYKPFEPLREDMSFITLLTRTPPYKVFCDKLLESSPREFEVFVGKLLSSLGGQVGHSNPGADQAVDLLWTTSAGDYIIQCKRWENRKVGVNVIREVHGAISNFRVKGAFVVTTSQFTDDAIEYKINLKLPIGLIDGKELFNLSNQINQNLVVDNM